MVQTTLQPPDPYQKLPKHIAPIPKYPIICPPPAPTTLPKHPNISSKHPNILTPKSHFIHPLNANCTTTRDEFDRSNKPRWCNWHSTTILHHLWLIPVARRHPKINIYACNFVLIPPEQWTKCTHPWQLDHRYYSWRWIYDPSLAMKDPLLIKLEQTGVRRENAGCPLKTMFCFPGRWAPINQETT